MKPNNNKTLITILFLLLAMQCSCLFGQNVIVLHKKNGKGKEDTVGLNRHIHVFTSDNMIWGKLTEINDSSITITKDKVSEKIPLKNIHTFYSKRNTTGKYIALLPFGFLDAFGIWLTVDLSSALQIDFLSSLGCFAMTVGPPGIITLYLIFHKKKYNLDSKYDLKIVKAQ
jgi:hypothetical protein